MTYNEMREKMLFHRIIEWDEDHITLDNNMTLKIQMTDNDCCAWAGGTFENVVLDACITEMSEIKYNAWENDDTYGCSARVNVFHNRNKICEINGDADAGNGGYYYSIASFIVSMSNGKTEQVHFVGSSDE